MVLSFRMCLVTKTLVCIETEFYLKHHILDEILTGVFRQFMKGMCQKNQLQTGGYGKIFAYLYLENVR